MSKYLINVLKLAISYLVLISWLFPNLSTASAYERDLNESVKIGSYLTPGLIKEDGTGLFNKLNNAIFMEISKKPELIISSINRARLGVRNGKLDSYFPELWENLPGERNQYVVSRPIFYKRIILFTVNGSGLTELSDFEEHPLGAVRGFSYGKEIISNPRLNITFQNNDVINIKLLLSNRLSGVLGGYPGTVNAVKAHNGANKIHYDLDKPVAILESFYVCNNDPEGVRLCNSIDKAIKSLLQKGILELNEATGFSRFTPDIL